MACDPPAGDFERSVLAVLAQPMTYRIEANCLTLRAADGNGFGLVAKA
jgi:heat shock protein HslJ